MVVKERLNEVYTGSQQRVIQCNLCALSRAKALDGLLFLSQFNDALIERLRHDCSLENINKYIIDQVSHINKSDA